MFQALRGRKKPLYLRLNDILYRFGTEKNDSTSGTAAAKMDLKETSQLYSTCKKAGLTNFISSTIATIMNQVEMNLDF